MFESRQTRSVVFYKNKSVGILFITNDTNNTNFASEAVKGEGLYIIILEHKQ